MRTEIGPPPLAAELRAVAADPAAPPAARADAVALLLGDVERMAGKRAAADAARTVLGRIASKVRWAAAGLRKFITRSNPPRIKAWKPPLLPGAPELKLVRVAPGRRGRDPIDGPGALAQVFAFITLSHREAVWIGLLDSKQRVTGIYMHTLGNVSSSAVYPSEILRVVLYSGLDRFVMVHNHPSGDPTPSNDDIMITQRIIDGCHLLGMQMLDSIVLAHHSDAKLKKGHELAWSSRDLRAANVSEFGMDAGPEGTDLLAVRYVSIMQAGLVMR